ncbi:MAG: TatD family hydrolase, partial [Thermodesulfobacteriota bacterium]
MGENYFLVDGHAHLNELSGLSGSLQEARAAGVRGIVGVGMDIESNKKIVQIARANNQFVYPALGYHPWVIKEEEMEANLSFVRDHAKEGVALGEIGLDYKIKVKKELQWKVFGELLDIALESDKPVIVHCRYSHRRAFDMVRERRMKRAVFHWYSGPLRLLDEILEAGYFISYARKPQAFKPGDEWHPFEAKPVETWRSGVISDMIWLWP